MPEKGAKWMDLRKSADELHQFEEFGRLSPQLQKCLKRMISEEPAQRPTIKQVINEIDEAKNKEVLWMNIAERAIKESKHISPKFRVDKLWTNKCKSFND